MKRRQLLQAVAAVVALPGIARAQGYPARSIRYIVPVAAGGGSDMIARVVTERWGKLIGQSFVVDNQSGGGGGVVAGTTTARAAPDGYTLLQSDVAIHGTTPAARRVSDDVIREFTHKGPWAWRRSCRGQPCFYHQPTRRKAESADRHLRFGREAGGVEGPGVGCAPDGSASASAGGRWRTVDNVLHHAQTRG